MTLDLSLKNPTFVFKYFQSCSIYIINVTPSLVVFHNYTFWKQEILNDIYKLDWT